MPWWAYALLCAVGPLLWAAAVVRVIRARDERNARLGGADRPPGDYSI